MMTRFLIYFYGRFITNNREFSPIIHRYYNNNSLFFDRRAKTKFAPLDAIFNIRFLEPLDPSANDVFLWMWILLLKIPTIKRLSRLLRNFYLTFFLSSCSPGRSKLYSAWNYFYAFLYDTRLVLIIIKALNYFSEWRRYEKVNFFYRFFLFLFFFLFVKKRE